MRSLATALLICALALLAPSGADALMILELSDGLGGVTTVSDNGAGDMNPTADTIVFSGAVGDYSVSFATGVSLSGPNTTTLTMNSLVSSTTAGTLDVVLIHTGYAQPVGAAIAYSNAWVTTDATVSVASYLDNDGDLDFSDATQLASFGPLTGAGVSSFVESSVLDVNPVAPFSLTVTAGITTSGINVSNVLIQLSIEGAPAGAAIPNPEPSGGVLFGVGSLLVAAALRRRAS